MNSIVIKTKLESLRKCLDRIESKKPETLDVLLLDIDIQDIIALNMDRSVQLCVDIANHILSSLDDAPAMSMADSFERLSEKRIIPNGLAQSLKKAVGFRNLSVHAYDKINWNLVWNILEGDLKDLAFDFLNALKNLMFKSFKEKYIIFVYYTIPLHLQPVFKNLGHQSGEFPVAEKVANQCLSLPMIPYLTQGGQTKVIDANLD